MCFVYATIADDRNRTQTTPDTKRQSVGTHPINRMALTRADDTFHTLAHTNLNGGLQPQNGESTRGFIGGDNGTNTRGGDRFSPVLIIAIKHNDNPLSLSVVFVLTTLAEQN